MAAPLRRGAFLAAKRRGAAAALALILLGSRDPAAAAEDIRPPAPAIRVGCFIGGKSYALYRAYALGYFERERVRAVFFSGSLGRTGFRRIPAGPDALALLRRGSAGDEWFGKVSGEDIIKAIEQRVFDAGTVGESSFIAAAARGAPLVAVAALAHDQRDHPGKAIVLRRGVTVREATGLRGRILASRRSGSGSDAIFLKEFLASAGLEPGKDVAIRDDVDEAALPAMLRDGSVDGALVHVEMARRLDRDGVAEVYRRMDWMNPEVSGGVLVVRRDYLGERRDDVRRFVDAYARRVRDERAAPDDPRGRERRRGSRVHLRFEGMDLPQCDDPPKVRPDLLAAMQALMLKHRLIDKSVDLRPFIDAEFLDARPIGRR